MRSEEFGFGYSRRSILVGCPFKEPRVICGTRGDPDTVAPFRAWRGSRDLVAQSPKLHERTVAKKQERECVISLTQRYERNGSAAVRVAWKFSRFASIASSGCLTILVSRLAEGHRPD